jgi:uncharacterized protein YciI
LALLFAITCYDRPGRSGVRRANRPAHLTFAASHTITLGGPVIDELGQPCGSLLVTDTPDSAAAEAFVAGDPYGLAGLFDRVTILGYRAVFIDGQPM